MSIIKNNFEIATFKVSKGTHKKRKNAEISEDVYKYREFCLKYYLICSTQQIKNSKIRNHNSLSIGQRSDMKFGRGFPFHNLSKLNTLRKTKSGVQCQLEKQKKVLHS